MIGFKIFEALPNGNLRINISFRFPNKDLILKFLIDKNQQ